MKQFISLLFVLSVFTTLFACHSMQNDCIYIIQDNVLIPRLSGIDFSSIIVRIKVNIGALLAILFYVTYHQSSRNAFLAKVVVPIYEAPIEKMFLIQIL